MAAGAFLGTFAGAQLAGQLRTRWLSLFFAVFVGYSGLAMLKNARSRTSDGGRPLVGTGGLVGAGTGIGLVSSLVGAGGGFITVPFLTRCRVAIHQAVATSAALGFAIAAGGLVGYIVAGWDVPDLPPFTIGFIHLPSLLCCAAASMTTAPLGARAAHALDVRNLKKIFAILLIGLAITMGWKGLRS